MARPDVQFTFPILKVEDQEDGSVIVEGTMTSEAVDQAGDVIDYDAFKAASTTWVGNIREMHQLTAVGRALGMEFDDEARRVTLTARISAGAPDTIAKVKDGTLRYYSIGGRAASRQADKVLKTEDGKPATRVFLRRISETSLVDSGCNPETGFSIVKVEDEEKVMTIDDVQKILLAPEITDAARALEILRALVWLYNDETSEQHPEPPEQAKLLMAAIVALKAFAISELGEQAEPPSPMPVESIPDVVVEMAAPAPEVQKIETPEPAPAGSYVTADVLKAVTDQLEILKAELSTVREEGAQLRGENAALKVQVEMLGASIVLEPGRPVHKAADGTVTTTAPGTSNLPISMERIAKIVQDNGGDPAAINRSLALEVGVELTKRATARK